MKHTAIFFCAIISLLTGSDTFAQRVADPLTIQGLEQYHPVGARIRAMGGAGTANASNSEALFYNPALLTVITQPEARLGGNFFTTQYEQTQQWVPNKLYAELTLIFQNEATFKTKGFDNIKPDWKKTSSKINPSMFSAAMPFTFDMFKVTAGFGFSEALNLDHYFQNNNALDPNIGQMRPAPIPRLGPTDSLYVRWFQYWNQRTGSIYGYTPAVSIGLGNDLSLGASVTILKGKTDDSEYRNDRGRFRLFYNNLFRLDSISHSVSTIGTSEYSATSITAGVYYRSDYLSAGVSITPGYKLVRKWEKTVAATDSGNTISVPLSGEDTVSYPFVGKLGLTLTPSDRLTLTFDYHFKQFSDAEYGRSDTSYHPWLSNNSFMMGFEYRAAKNLYLRGGYRDETQVFAGEGAGLMNQPVSGSVYTAGAGYTYYGVTCDLTYEYYHLAYEDAWESNINFNKINRHSVSVQLGYKF